ncbi:MAG: hypothetical protein MJZ38_01010 [archaeon]|nr:hypothetical protein [archaeon]
MGLFRKKGETVIAPPEPLVRDNANWRDWSHKGFTQFESGDTPSAILHWVGAVDRCPDPTTKQFNLFRDDIYRAFLRQLEDGTRNGLVIPLHLVAEVDAEIYVKHHGVFEGHLTEKLFYDVKEMISGATGPQEVTTLFVSGVFAIVGQLRYIADMREAVSKCQEGLLLGSHAISLCEDFQKTKFTGRLRPKAAIEFIDALNYTFRRIIGELEKTLGEMDEERLLALREYRRTHVEDRLKHIGAAFHLSINAIGVGHISSKKLDEGLSTEIPAYVEDFLRME